MSDSVRTKSGKSKGVPQKPSNKMELHVYNDNVKQKPMVSVALAKSVINCHSCNLSDNSRMVQCDVCDEWFHYSCVGVTHDIEHEDWTCRQCRNAEATHQKLYPTRIETEVTSGLHDYPASKHEHHTSTKEPNSIPFSKVGSMKSSSSKQSAKALLELKLRKLEEEYALKEEEMKWKREMLEKRFRILEQLSDVDNSEMDEQDATSKVNEWLRDRSNRSDGEVEALQGYGCPLQNRTDDGHCTDKQQSPAQPFQPCDRSTPKGHECDSSLKSSRGSNTYDCNRLTRDQLAARQVVPKDLPKFSGNPEEWPMFFSTYESTTNMCGYRNEENMIRLRNCLKDDAYVAVRSFLMHPSTLSKAIAVLKLRFGQPHTIINSLKNKITAMPPVRPDAMDKLVDFALAVQNLCATIEACQCKEYLNDASFLQELIVKLPAALRLEWARSNRAMVKGSLETFSSWMYSIAEDACLIVEPRNINDRTHHIDYRKGKSYVNTHAEHTSSMDASTRSPLTARPHNATEHTESCIACKGNCESLDKCIRFTTQSYDAKWATIREARLCRKCLRQHKGGCYSKPCGINGCTYKHHPLLHKQWSPRYDTNNEGNAKQSETQNCHAHQLSTNSTLLRYLPVVLYGTNKELRCYAFLDEGSGSTLLDQGVASYLGLQGEVKPLCLQWTGGMQRYEANSQQVDLNISGSDERKYYLRDVRTVEELRLPCQTLNMAELKSRHDYLRDLPVQSYENIRPNILIGLKHANVMLVRKSREGQSNQPIAIKTRLGWSVYGGTSSNVNPSLIHFSFHVSPCSCNTYENLHQTVKEYFSLECLGITRPAHELMSNEDKRSLHLLESRTSFNGERYESGLLWRYDDIRLPDNRPLAQRRLYCLEKRMEKDPELKRIMESKMAEYLKKKYIRKLTDEELKENHDRIWYLPIFPVTNPNKPEKVRIVWDAAAAIHGVSLNSTLLVGPDNLVPLLSILFQFRENRVAVGGDIREMFHQVRIRNEDQHSQRFLWHDGNERSEASVYVMCVMIFGACCSPSTAQFIKNLNADLFKHEYPEAVKVIKNGHYVDDLLVSVEDEREAIKLAKAVKLIHAHGGFEIRNWTSNSQRVLLALDEKPAMDINLNLHSKIAAEKILGLWWNTSTDHLTFKFCWSRYDENLLNGKERPTKRVVLRVLMTIFDPLGLIANYLIPLKILLQDIWRSGIKWDEKLDDNLFVKWQQWVGLLQELEQISIPRCYRQRVIASETYEAQLHVFVDASETGVAAAVYLRFAQNKMVECSLVGAKTRVAPLTYLSIPRLELTAALLGVRLANTICGSISTKITKRIFWTDSRNVLCWIRSDHRRYNQYVAARVGEILESTDVSDWRWVPTKINVADEGTKWQRSMKTGGRSRWLEGPEFLLQPESSWPSEPFGTFTTSDELRPSVLFHLTINDVIIAGENFSTWRRLINVTAYVHRFVINLRKKHNGEPCVYGPPSSDELHVAERYHYKQAQHEVYPDELAIVSVNDKQTGSIKQIPKNSSLFKLTPFLDENGVLRMTGRAGACDVLDPETRNPIILPPEHYVTVLIIKHYHSLYHHRNHELIINELRQRYSIARIRNTYKKVRRNCQRCKNLSAIPHPPAMASLPPGRLAVFKRPFTHAGVDYFGPMEVSIGRRTEKRWGVLLTCLTIRAVHLELASSLSTSSCILALRNFIARRGKPAVFYSDRGTNFIGANRELNEAMTAINHNSLMQEFVTTETTWSFNPPASPHMGGSWERLVQSVKKNVMMMQTVRRPTEEELRNALIEVEGILNSRPLTHVPIDEVSAPALTPNHFLIGSSDGFKPLTLLDNSTTSLRRCWQTSQVMANQFWKRWIRDYLPEITRRTKWHYPVKPIEVGDVVVIVDPDHPRNCWPKGRVIATVNKDGQVRRATVQTSKGVYERPAVKLAVLDVGARN